MFRKWELVEENKAMVKETYMVLWGIKMIHFVSCDVYRKQSRSGIYKYKYVER